MDVRFSNVVEVTRQYFQGVPPGVGSGPPAGQAPAQRPPSYWAGASSQAPYPPVSSAPSPLPYPNQQQQNRLPSIGAFTSGQQRSTSVLPSVNQIKQGLSVQDYPSSYTSRGPSAYKYQADQQASAALYNPIVNQRHSVSPRTQPSSNGGTPSIHMQGSSQQNYLQAQSSNQASYHAQSSHLHQQLTEAAKQLTHLQANQANHQLSSQSQSTHTRQSPHHSTPQQMLANHQLLGSHLHHSQQSSIAQELPRRSPVTHQTAVQLLQAQRQQSVLHTQQQPPGSNQMHVHQQVSPHLHHTTHRQQVTAQASAHRMPSPAPSHHGLSSHHMSSHSSQLGTQHSLQSSAHHHQAIQSTSHSHKTQSSNHQQNFSHASSQQISHHQLMSHLQHQSHQSMNTPSQTPHIQATYQSQQHHISVSNPSNSSHRMPSPSPLHQANPSMNQNQHHMNVIQQQHRSTITTINSPANQTTSYMSSTSTQGSFNQNFLNNSTSRILGQLNTGGNVGSLPSISSSITHSRDSLATSNHSNVNLGNVSGAVRDVNHVNFTNLINSSIREGIKSNIPNITNMMSNNQLHHHNPVNSRSSTLSQTSPVPPRKSDHALQSTSVINLSSSSAALGDPSSVLNLSDTQSQSVVNLANPASNQSAPSLNSAPSHRSIVSGIVKRESPLDLSVKTVRQSADSTAADEEYINLIYYERASHAQQSSYGSSSIPYEVIRNNHKPVTAPKVDFTPDFSSTAHILPKKKKAAEIQQYSNNLPSIGSFVKPQLPRTRAETLPYYQSGPSTSSVTAFPQGHQMYPEVQNTANNFPLPVKRHSEEPLSAAPPPKIPRADDAWRQTIDRQIDKKINSYLTSKSLNGERTFEPPPQNFRFPQYPQSSPKSLERPVSNGQADKRVLNILRTSLETREARNKATSIPVDRLPKAPVIHQAQSVVRQNLPPFGAIGTYPKDVPPLQTKPVEIVDITDDLEENEPKKMLNGTATNGELDGLAAFLASRIRTKAELKQQVDPGGPNRFGQSSVISSVPSFNQNLFPSRVIKTDEDADASSKQTVKGQTPTVSPPKLTKEHGVTVNIPRKRDSDSESEMPPVLERQRKSCHTSSSISQTQLVTHVQLTVPVTSLPDPPTPPVIKEEDLPQEEKDWLKRCDELIDQLKSCSSSNQKKKRLKKRRLKIKRLKEEPQDGLNVEVKRETLSPTLVTVKQEPDDTPVVHHEAPMDDEQDLLLEDECESELEEAEIAWQRRGCLGRKKKPLGDGSHFVPGWQDEVYRYKQSLRMPDSLISIARPTSSLPDLQNYMDSPAGGDTTPGNDFTPESTPVKPSRSENIAQCLNQEKTILDKLMERFKLNRTEPEAHDSKNPYMDYLNKERKKARGRSQSRKFIKKKATFKEIFGEERPASAPPAGVREGERKKASVRSKVMLRSMLKLRSKRTLRDRQPIMNKPKKRRGPKPRAERGPPGERPVLAATGEKPETRRTKRKGKSSGFDYIKKKKKISKDNVDRVKKPKKKKCVPMTESEIKEELKTWILNKESGETTLQRASRLGYTEVVQYCLSELKEKATSKDYAGFTPLHEAASQGHIDIAKLLLENGANVNEPAQGGIRPLHEAAENGFTDLMDVLLRYGANPDLSTCNGQTALSLATDLRSRRIIEQYCMVKPIEPQPTTTVPAEKIIEEKDDGDSVDGFEIEESDMVLPSLYRLMGEPRSSSWVLYHELAPLVRSKTKDSLVRRLGASIMQDTRDLRPSDFYAKARTRTLVMGDTERKPPKLATKMSRVTLFRYTQAVRLLLDVETTVIPR